jgi:predicted CXXCH cytochrome family protein
MRRALSALSAAALAPVFLAAASPPAPRLHGHASALGPCELATADRRSTSSQRCLACHDGTAAAAVPLGYGAGPGDHPVEMEYERSRMSGRSLRPTAELPQALPLVGGRVACTTCHSIESAEPGHTAMTMQRSAMCLACHDL